MFFKIGVLKNFVIFTGKYLYWRLFLIKLSPKSLQHRYFLVNIAKFLRTPFLRKTSVAASAVLKNSYIPRKTSVAEASRVARTAYHEKPSVFPGGTPGVT